MDYAKIILIFASIIYEALPFVVLGVILAGLLEEFVPQQLIARFMPKTKTMIVFAIGLGGLLGLIFPMCECGIIAVMRRLLRKGVPLSVCVCYMLAGPIINVVVMTSTYVAFSRDASLLQYAVLLRVGLGFLVAFTTSLLVEWQYRKYGNELLVPIVAQETRVVAGGEENNQQKRTVAQRLGNITETALHDFVDIMAFLVLGAFLASFGRVLLSSNGVFERMIREWPTLSIPIMMLFALIFCLCSEADAFVAANFQPIGLWPPASKLAFLVMGPMFDLKLLMMYTRVFRKRLIVIIFGSVVLQVLAYALIVHANEADIWEFLKGIFPPSTQPASDGS